jgi:hypothetical protein
VELSQNSPMYICTYVYERDENFRLINSGVNLIDGRDFLDLFPFHLSLEELRTSSISRCDTHSRSLSIERSKLTTPRHKMMTTTTSTSKVASLATAAGVRSTSSSRKMKRSSLSSLSVSSSVRTNAMMKKNDDDDYDVTATTERSAAVSFASRRRNAVLSAFAAASLLLVNPEEAEASAPAEFAEETLKMINMTRDILNGKDYDSAKKAYDAAKLAEFEEYRTYWFDKYQYQHGKSFYGYANTWNAQAKVGFQISMSSKEGAKSEYPNGFDPESTAYNKAYLLKILDKAEDEIKDYDSRNAF